MAFNVPYCPPAWDPRAGTARYSPINPPWEQGAIYCRPFVGVGAFLNGTWDDPSMDSAGVTVDVDPPGRSIFKFGAAPLTVTESGYSEEADGSVLVPGGGVLVTVMLNFSSADEGKGQGKGTGGASLCPSLTIWQDAPTGGGGGTELARSTAYHGAGDPVGSSACLHLTYEAQAADGGTKYFIILKGSEHFALGLHDIQVSFAPVAPMLM